MVLIFVKNITSRKNYLFGLIFRDVLNIPFLITSDNAEFTNHSGPKFSYGESPLDDEIFFEDAGLLNESGLKLPDIKFIFYEGLPAFFPVNKKESAFPFDPFSASFFLVSRFEEYLPHTKDYHGRYPSNQSLAFRHGFIDKPIVNIWIELIRKKLLEHFPEMVFPEKSFRFLPTIDIDNAWAFKNKGFLRNSAGILSDLIQCKFNHVKCRIGTIFGQHKDPYDTYEYQIQLFEKCHLKPIYFFLIGDYSRYDKNIPFDNKYFQSLIIYLDHFGDVGIHPSYASNESTHKLSGEISRLSSILRKRIKLSRQHFIKMNLPETYRNLIKMEISDEYSMGYSDIPGFRAGICTPFYFYDVEREEETSLRVHPFCLMDGTMKDYMNLTPNQAIHIIDKLIVEVKKVSGDFISIWHNESFCENKRWKGWRKVYEHLIQKSIEK